MEGTKGLQRWDIGRGYALRDYLFSLFKVRSIRSLSRVVGVSPSHLSSIFSGQRSPTPSLLSRLATAAGTDPDELLRATDAMAKTRTEGKTGDARLLSAAISFAEAELVKRPALFDSFRTNFCAFLIASGRADLPLSSSLYSSLSSPSSLASRLAGASPETARVMLHALAYTLFPLEYAASGSIGLRDLSLDRLPPGFVHALHGFCSAHGSPEAGEGGMGDGGPQD